MPQNVGSNWFRDPSKYDLSIQALNLSYLTRSTPENKRDVCQHFDETIVHPFPSFHRDIMIIKSGHFVQVELRNSNLMGNFLMCFRETRIHFERKLLAHVLSSSVLKTRFTESSLDAKENRKSERR